MLRKKSQHWKTQKIYGLPNAFLLQKKPTIANFFLTCSLSLYGTDPKPLKCGEQWCNLKFLLEERNSRRGGNGNCVLYVK